MRARRGQRCSREETRPPSETFFLTSITPDQERGALPPWGHLAYDPSRRCRIVEDRKESTCPTVGRADGPVRDTVRFRNHPITAPPGTGVSG